MNYLKRHLFAMIAVATLASVANAQVQSEASLDAEVEAQIDQMYPQAQAAADNKSQVITQNVVVSKAVQKQPVTVVEASPLSNSNADAIRRNRQEEELRTETRIVEKLELSRMEDEKRRAQVLFGDKFDNMNNHQQAQPIQQETIVAPSSQIQPQPIVVEQKPSLTREEVNQEVRAAIEADRAEKAEYEETSLFERKYISAQAGVPMYSDAESIKGNYSFGLGLGTSNDYLEVEGGFVFSSYKLEDSQYLAYGTNTTYGYYGSQYAGQTIGIADFDMKQYQTYVAAKLLVMAGEIRPTIGALASYSYRTYTSEGWTTYGGPGTDFGKSNAIDLGVTAGLDIALNRRFTVGADFKYMFNMSSNIEGDTVYGAQSPEKLNYYQMGIVAKLGF